MSKQEVIDEAYLTLVRYREELGGKLPARLQNLAATLVDHTTIDARQEAMRIVCKK